MSFRRVPGDDDRLVAWIQATEDRLSRLENGGPTAGELSFGDVISVGDVEISVLHVPGSLARTVTFRNKETASTFVITLP
jgi:hypothetical protein